MNGGLYQWNAVYLICGLYILQVYNYYIMCKVCVCGVYIYIYTILCTNNISCVCVLHMVFLLMLVHMQIIMGIFPPYLDLTPLCKYCVLTMSAPILKFVFLTPWKTWVSLGPCRDTCSFTMKSYKISTFKKQKDLTNNVKDQLFTEILPMEEILYQLRERKFIPLFTGLFISQVVGLGFLKHQQV